MFLIVSAILCSCAIVPKPQIGLEEFVHNPSRDMDCLQYCAERATGKQGTDFVRIAIFRKDGSMDKPFQFYNAVMFYDIINGTEYLYVQGNTENDTTSLSSNTIFMRFDLNNVDQISCKKLYSV